MKNITIKVDENGNVVISTAGFKGKACTQEIEKMNQGLKTFGIETETKEISFTPEYYQQEQVKQKQNVRT